MMSMLLQDWTTLQISGGGSIVQGSESWLNLEDAEDIVFALEVKEVDSPILTHYAMHYETSPCVQEANFVDLVPVFTLVAGLRSDRAMAAYSSPRIAQWVRWRLMAVGTRKIATTFRIWVSVYGSSVRDVRRQQAGAEV